MKRKSIVVWLLVLLFALTACGGSSSPIQGKWEVHSEELLSSLKTINPNASEAKCYFQISDSSIDLLLNDKPFVDVAKETLKGMGVSEDMIAQQMGSFPFPISYKLLDNNEIEMTAQGETHKGKYKLDGDKLTLEFNGNALELTKAK